MPKPRYTIKDFNRDFPDDDACLAYVARLIYSTAPENGIGCRACKVERKHHRLSTRKAYTCDYCGTHVYPLAGTIFEKSSTSLKSWLYAMFLMGQTRCGISAKQVERELGVTYKTAWRMFNQIRKLMGEEVERLSGEVEADETYVGGRRRGTPRGRPGKDSHKVPVVGVVKRGGKGAALVTSDTTRASVSPIMERKVLPKSLVYTDEYKVYDHLGRKGLHPQTGEPFRANYVVGNVHTNTIEGFWSLLKNGIRGVYHSVGAKHLQSYVNEYAFRYNHRADDQAMPLLVRERVRHVRHGKHGEYAPVG